MHSKRNLEKVHHHYDLTKINPADVASHGLNLLHDSEERIKLWITGPPFLRYTDQWPPTPKSKDTTLAVMHMDGMSTT